MQILIDENNVVIAAVTVGGLVGGLNVEEIPDDVMVCPSKWKYEDGKYTENPNYTPPVPEITTDELALAVAELAENAAADKLEIEMAIAELAEVIFNG